jgi:hypothetical protein
MNNNRFRSVLGKILSNMGRAAKAKKVKKEQKKEYLMEIDNWKHDSSKTKIEQVDDGACR